MTHSNAITPVHIKKLGHAIDEIRSRALDNIISKFDHGFGCDCDAVKKELIMKLFNWFSFEIVIQPEKALDLLYRLVKTNDGSFLNAFGKLRFQNECHELRLKLDSTWHDKLNLIEEVALSSKQQGPTDSAGTQSKTTGSPSRNHEQYAGRTYDHQIGDGDFESQYPNSSNNVHAYSDSTIPFDLTLQCGDGTHISKKTEGGIKWLVMPWQSLVTSDKGVLSAVEEALSNTMDTSLILHTCQFITNVMLQDFPAEVFLQRPAIVSVLHTLINSSGNNLEVSMGNVVSTVLKTLYKLTRSLRFRIYYYCDPCVANKKQKLLAGNLESIAYPSSEDRDSPEGGLPEANYQAYQSAGTSDRSQSIMDNVDESVLQLQQMTIPMYCIESLKHVITLLSIPINSTFPLKNVKYVMDLTYELVQLVITSVMPTIWLCRDGVALKIHEDLKSLMQLFGEVMEYFGKYSSVDHCRITYLHLVCIVNKMLSNIVPLELADLVLPKSLKISISIAIIDAPIYLLYPGLHSTLQEYARQFHGKNETDCVKLFDETRLIIKSMKAAISLLKDSTNRSHPDLLKTLYASKLSLSYHKNLIIVKKAVTFLQRVKYNDLDKESQAIATKLTLGLLANGDADIQCAMYTECHDLVKRILGVSYSKERYTWENIKFLFEQSIFTEIICHGVTNEDEKIKDMAEAILVYMLKGKVQLGENGYIQFLEAIVPVLGLLQCLAHPSTALGKCITKMLDPDLSTSIQLADIEVLKGNIRLLLSPDHDIREEAVCRLIWLLGKEKDSTQKLPRLSSLHGLPLSSLCIFERQNSTKQSQGNYQRSSLLSVLEMLNAPGVEPKMRKSALVQISVMLTDTSLHKLFVSENGLPLILKIFTSALVEKEYANYPDSVTPILTILKLISSTDNIVRHDLSIRIDVFLNILRSLFLFPNKECVRIDASHLLCLLLYDEYIMRLGEKHVGSSNQLNISLPHIIVSRMRLPYVCKSHWKTSIHRRSDVSVLHSSNQVALTFVRQFWAWEWNGGVNMLWQSWETLNDSDITEKLMIREQEFATFQYTLPHYYCQRQLYNIQNSTTHDGVSCALDYLTMYLRFYNMLKCEQMDNISSLPWEQSFERFLLSHPTSKEDCDLFVNVLSFLYIFINVTRDEKNMWLCKIMKNMTKSLADLLRSLDTNNQDVHQSVLRLARACSAIEQQEQTDCKDSKDTWIHFIELVVSNLCFGDQQHFYNLAYLDWLLTCLTYLTGKCQWSSHKNLLISLGNALMELIISFHGAGTVSYMGLSITRNSIICLNHLLHQMQTNLDKNMWTGFWYEEGRCLSWLPMLWRNRDPLVRASALQLLAGLTNAPHTASQLLHAISLAPSELCHTLIHSIANREESCIVREQASVAFSNMIKNCNSVTFQYADSLKANAILIYVEQSNIYYEISVLCSNLYMHPTLDLNASDNENDESGKMQSEHSRVSDYMSLVPRTVSYLYNCQDELQLLSVKDSEITDDENYPQFIATPSLITSICTLLNNLIAIGQHEVVRLFYEHSLDKYFLGYLDKFSNSLDINVKEVYSNNVTYFLRCFNGIPKTIDNRRNFLHYCDILEMYTALCTVLTNCITHGNDFMLTATFSPDALYSLLSLLNTELYYMHTPRLVYLRNRLWNEIFNLLSVLSITDSQHYESVETALELCGTEAIVRSMCIAIKNSTSELQMSAIGALASLLSQEIQRETSSSRNGVSLKSILDTCMSSTLDNPKNHAIGEVLSNVNKLSIKNASIHTRRSHEKDHIKTIGSYGKSSNEKCIAIGSEICKILLQLYIAHSYARTKTNRKQSEDKDLIVGALTNLLCISAEAKKTALDENLSETTLMQLKELYVKLNLQPYELYRNHSDRERKIHPLLHDVNCIFTLLMNFMYGNVQVKETMARDGLADVLHKLWAWISINKVVLISALKLLATFTTSCPEGNQSLTLTTTLPGVGLRKTPNTVALIHVIVHVVSKEIEKAGQKFDNQKLHFAFHILRNAVHTHECRVSISKSNLLQLFSKIHPITTKRVKPWPLVEMYCLEFLIDFTYYEEGQLCVPKAVDGLDVLIHLARCSSLSTRILAISTLRNLAFNVANRPRLLSSVDFINLLHNIFKNGTLAEIGVAGSTLWSLVSNNQKGKLIARSAGFPQSIQEVLGRLTLLTIADAKQEQELVKMLQYVMRILSTTESKSNDEPV
ncbi:rotatin isoform X2 [Cephus cinctus]|uniref:Rotatin isoform X2 n=1 Tax=Cephus cinctus TaxID=211228 RepID=A0AAJ7C5A4_CEPCN|nr:rotatin isoform X2 [Cephus cinctus]